MNIIIGSARSDENKRYSGGKKGDQRQTSNIDYTGEVSMQNFYVHSKGWIILRFNNPVYAINVAKSMITACNNRNVGYNQSDRYDILKVGTSSKVPCNCDCSSLVRQCIKEATRIDPGDFNTSNEVKVLMKTNLFKKIEYKPGVNLFTGDVLVTKTKGHTIIVTIGNPRSISESNIDNVSTKTPSYNKTIKLQGVTTSTLNVRTGPDTSYPNLSGYPTLAKDTRVNICDTTSNGWHYIKLDGSKGVKYGFVSGRYVKIIN